MKGITDKELMEYLKWPVLYRIRNLKGKCHHCGGLTDPAYVDIAKAMYGIGRSNILNLAITRTLHNLEELGYVVGDGGYYRRGTHGGAGAKKWRLTEKGEEAYREHHEH